jgi:hypothetical protein
MLGLGGARTHSLGVWLRRGIQEGAHGRLRSLLFRRKRYQSLGSRILYGSLSRKRDTEACHQTWHMNNKHKQYGATTKDCWQPPKRSTCSMLGDGCSVMDARLHRNSSVVVHVHGRHGRHGRRGLARRYRLLSRQLTHRRREVTQDADAPAAPPS